MMTRVLFLGAKGPNVTGVTSSSKVSGLSYLLGSTVSYNVNSTWLLSGDFIYLGNVAVWSFSSVR